MLTKSYKVLVVDDEPAMLDIVRLFLGESGRFNVTTVSSAKGALDLLQVRRFDAIVSDYQMPGMDGIGLLKELRSKGDGTPFVLFTGKGREDVAVEALNSGADFYVRKGHDVVAQFAELENAVMQAIKRRGVEQIIDGIFRLTPLMLMMVDEDRCVHAFNRALAELAPVPKEQIEGTRCGVLFNCDNSRADERGCGFSPQCPDCKVWGAVEKTIRTGESCYHIQATIPHTQDGVRKNVRLKVSTTPIRSLGHDLALVCVEDIDETNAE